MTGTWEKEKPYTQMLGKYESAAEKVAEKKQALRSELKQIQREEARRERSLEEEAALYKRIETLRMEYEELTDAIREIRIYAEKEQ
ncbi:MAG: hypothetical protein MJ071_01035 [Oscillospiraceae bacterium]|nr:hypothetical protein [Oscillospiraceae bacterium]